VIAKGHAYLENDKGERKASGSYYTPDHIVSYIVEQAVGPVLREKFEAMRPRLREAERWHRDAIRTAKAKGEKPEKYETGPAVEKHSRALVSELFDVKVLDPAMGSGHFLVDAVDYITDKALDFLNAFPWNPVTAHLSSGRIEKRVPARFGCPGAVQAHARHLHWSMVPQWCEQKEPPGREGASGKRGGGVSGGTESGSGTKREGLRPASGLGQSKPRGMRGD